MSHGRNNRCAESGQSFIDLLMGVAISGLVLAGLSKVLVDSSRAGKRIEVASELESVRQIMVKSFSCSKSLGLDPGESVTTCSPTPSPIKDFGGTLLTDDKGRVSQTEFYVKLRCEENVGVFFEYRRAKASGSGLVPLEDPLTGKTVAGYQDLFPSEPFCNEYFGNSPTADPGATATIPNVICATGRVFMGFSDNKPVCRTLEQDLKDPPAYTAVPTVPTTTRTCIALGPMSHCWTNTGGNSVSFLEAIATWKIQPTCIFTKSTDNGLTYTEVCP